MIQVLKGRWQSVINVRWRFLHNGVIENKRKLKNWICMTILNIQVSQQKKNICDDELHSSQSCYTPVINQKCILIPKYWCLGIRKIHFTEFDGWYTAQKGWQFPTGIMKWNVWQKKWLELSAWWGSLHPLHISLLKCNHTPHMSCVTQK